jgi:hypothetical protein
MSRDDELTGRLFPVRTIALVLLLVALLPAAAGAVAITQIIDRTGDGATNTLDGAAGVAVDGWGNVYVVGASTRNAFRIDPNGADRAPLSWTPEMRG